MNTTANFQGKPEAQAVAEIVEQHLEPKAIAVARGTPEATGLLAVAQGVRLESTKKFLDEYLDKPERRKGTASLGTLQSFIDHANRFKDADSAIFASEDPTEPRLTSVLDYHRAGGAADPRFGQHRGVYEFPLSEEWEAWTGKDGETMGQAEFAEFIESNVLNVAPPGDAAGGALEFARTLGVEFASSSRLVELSRGLTIREASKVTQIVNIGSGEAQLGYTSEHQDERGQPLKIPGAFLLNLRVFRNGEVFQVAARLRYRLKQGVVVFFYDLWRVDKVFEVAFGEACSKAATETGLPLFVGSPEA